jgi:hypothetical protein
VSIENLDQLGAREIGSGVCGVRYDRKLLPVAGPGCRGHPHQRKQQAPKFHTVYFQSLEVTPTDNRGNEA